MELCAVIREAVVMYSVRKVSAKMSCSTKVMTEMTLLSMVEDGGSA